MIPTDQFVIGRQILDMLASATLDIASMELRVHRAWAFEPPAFPALTIVPAGERGGMEGGYSAVALVEQQWELIYSLRSAGTDTELERAGEALAIAHDRLMTAQYETAETLPRLMRIGMGAPEIRVIKGDGFEEKLVAIPVRYSAKIRINTTVE